MPAGVNLFLHLLHTVLNAVTERWITVAPYGASSLSEDNQSLCRLSQGPHGFVSIGQTDLQRVRQTLIGSYRSGADTASLIFHRAQ